MSIFRMMCTGAFVTLILASLAAAQDTPLPAQDTVRSSTDEVIDFFRGRDARPFLEAGYGYGMLSHKDFSGDLPTMGVIQGRIGYRTIRPFKKINVHLDDRFFVGSYSSSTLAPGKETSDSLNADVYRFGAGQRVGYGWDFLHLTPYHQYSISALKMVNSFPSSLSSPDSAILARAGNAYKLGMTTEAGLSAELFSTLGVAASYEAAVIYNKVVVWEWLGSYFIAATAIGAISTFADDIVGVSPVLGPVLYFVLRNGVALAYFYALSDNMNWPFDSETPMMTHSFRLDFSLRF
jgi:hypothetical protein